MIFLFKKGDLIFAKANTVDEYFAHRVVNRRRHGRANWRIRSALTAATAHVRSSALSPGLTP